MLVYGTLPSGSITASHCAPETKGTIDSVFRSDYGNLSTGKLCGSYTLYFFLFKPLISQSAVENEPEAPASPLGTLHPATPFY